MEGYCTKDFDSSVSTLHIEVKNLPEFEKLVNQAKEEADQLKKTIRQLQQFELKIDFSIRRQLFFQRSLRCF